MIASKYLNRLTYLLSQVTECCGQAEDLDLCAKCRIKITKCNILVKKWNISFVEYVKLLKKIQKEYNPDKYNPDNYNPDKYNPDSTEQGFL